MKDPLRYYLAEGFMCLFYAPSTETFGKFRGNYRSTVSVSNKLRVTQVLGQKCLVVENVGYPINSDFWLDYGVRCESYEEVIARCQAWADSTNAVFREFETLPKLDTIES